MLFHDFLNYENILVLTQRGTTIHSVLTGMVLFSAVL